MSEAEYVAPKVSVSYSWQDEAHLHWLGEFAARLRGDRVDYGGPGEDLIDCAYKATRANDVGDTAYYIPGEDVVVDCMTKNPLDPTSPQPWDPTSSWDSSDPTDPTYVAPAR